MSVASMSVTPLPTAAPQAAALSDVLAALDVGPESEIQVAGPDGLPVLLWLCRRGFEHAAYVRCDAPRPSGQADALIIPHALSGEALLRLLDGAPRVRVGGALVVQARAPEAGADATPIDALLQRLGYAVVIHRSRGGRELIAARRTPTAWARAA